MQTPKHVNKYLSGTSGSLHQIANHCAQLQHLTQLVRDFLPSPLNQHCQVANLKDHQLILHSDSSIWGTMLHYQTPVLLQYLNHQPGLEHISNIRTRTVPRYPQDSGGKPSLSRPVDDSKATLISHLAEGMANPALKEALLRLVRHSADSSRD